MTRQQQLRVKCPNCQTEVETATPFSQWLRDLKSPLSSEFISNQNLDYVWHHYRTPQWLILLEEKRFGGEQSKAQQDTHGILTQLLQQSSGAKVKAWRGETTVEFRGYYLVVFEKTTPEDSAWVEINSKRYDTPKASIIHLLTNGRMEEQRVIQLTPFNQGDEFKFWQWLQAQPTIRLTKVVSSIMNIIRERAEKEIAA